MNELVSLTDVISIVNQEIIKSSDFMQHDTQRNILAQVDSLRKINLKQEVEKLELKRDKLLQKAAGNKNSLEYREACGLDFAIKSLEEIRTGKKVEEKKEKIG